MARQSKKDKSTVVESMVTPLDLSSFNTPAIDSVEPEFKVNIHSADTDESGVEPEKKKRGRKPGSKNSKPTSDNGDPLIDGETLVMFIDIIIPLAIATLNNTMTEKKISPDDLLLTDKIKEKMKLFADKCAEQINISMNPWVGLGLIAAGGYGYKYLELKNKK